MRLTHLFDARDLMCRVISVTRLSLQHTICTLSSLTEFIMPAVPTAVASTVSYYHSSSTLKLPELMYWHSCNWVWQLTHRCSSWGHTTVGTLNIELAQRFVLRHAHVPASHLLLIMSHLSSAASSMPPI